MNNNRSDKTNDETYLVISRMGNFSNSSVLTFDNNFIAITTNEYSAIVSPRFMVYLKEHVHQRLMRFLLAVLSPR